MFLPLSLNIKYLHHVIVYLFHLFSRVFLNFMNLQITKFLSLMLLFTHLYRLMTFVLIHVQKSFKDQLDFEFKPSSF